MKRLCRCLNSVFFSTNNLVIENIVNISLKNIAMLQELLIWVVWQDGSSGKRVICCHISIEYWNKYEKLGLVVLAQGEK